MPSIKGNKVRKPAVAGSFYPASKSQIKEQIKNFMENVHQEFPKGRIFAIVSPHAGYVYSGQVASYGYKLIQGKEIKRVIIISPSHAEYFPFASVFTGKAYETPLGTVEVDLDLAVRIASKGELVKASDRGHLQDNFARREHALEVQLPFLQEVLKDFKIVPIVMGDQNWEICEALGKAIAPFLKDPETIVVASSDLSHFHPYDEALRLDKIFCDHLASLDAKGIAQGIKRRAFEACGAGPVMATIIAAKEAGANSCRILKTANSGDVTGDKSSVVGYASAVISSSQNDPETKEKQKKEFNLSEKERSYLLKLARKSIAEDLGIDFEEPAPPETADLTRKSGAFVTLKINGNLRGCIGYIEAIKPLKTTIREMAKAAAFHDPRFPALSKEEFEQIDIEISVLSPVEPVPDPSKIEVGRDGLIIERGMNRGLLLPQVAVEYRWDRTEFLEHTCRKAMLPPDAWKDKGTKIYSFTAVVFGEKEGN